jgi:opacity protein-like surface antigen
MHIKRALLATSALAVIAGIGPAQAAGPIYVSVFGGANFQQHNSAHDSSIFASTDTRSDPDTGFLLGAEVGVHLDKWLHGLRAGVEASYRRNDIKGQWFETHIPGVSSGGPIDGAVSTFAVMANVWYDIELGYKWRPYLGGGAGWARTHVHAVAVTAFTGGGERGGSTSTAYDSSGFAWQLGAGVNYEIQDGVNVGLGYRFFRGPNIRNDIFVGKNDVPINFENESHSVLLSLTVDTN